jgi:hypothetical protein
MKWFSLLPNWKEVLRKSWSLRWIILAAIFTGIESVLVFLPDDAGSRLTMAPITFVVVCLALYFRLVAQRNLDEPRDESDEPDSRDRP